MQIEDGVLEELEKHLERGSRVSVCPYSLCSLDDEDHIYRPAVSVGWGKEEYGVSLYSLNLLDDEKVIIRNSLPEKSDQYDETVYNLVEKRAIEMAEEICKFLEEKEYNPEMGEFEVNIKK